MFETRVATLNYIRPCPQFDARQQLLVATLNSFICLRTTAWENTAEWSILRKATLSPWGDCNVASPCCSQCHTVATHWLELALCSLGCPWVNSVMSTSVSALRWFCANSKNAPTLGLASEGGSPKSLKRASNRISSFVNLIHLYMNV